MPTTSVVHQCSVLEPVRFAICIIDDIGDGFSDFIYKIADGTAITHSVLLGFDRQWLQEDLFEI